ncbi:MAG: ISH3 family transposase, partial [Conexivisphaera sp.]
MNVVTMDARFYSVGVLRLLSRYKFIMAVPIHRIGVNGVVDTQYTTDSNRRSRGNQASFRLVTMKVRVRHRGHRKRDEERLLGYATNLSIPPIQLRRLYNRLRNPVETSYRRIKSLLPFTSSTRFTFRHLVIVLAVLLYSLLVSSGLRRSRFARGMPRA